MKHIKHWLATMAVLLCSVTASAYDFKVGGIYYNITSDTDLTVEITYEKYDGSYYIYSSPYSGNIVIPESVTYNSETYQVTSIGNSAFRECSSLTSITLPESVTSIGSSAFSDCSSLTSITLPKSVTSIGSNAFYFCSSLTSITIPEGVTSIGKEAFQGCSSLTSINIPESVTSIGQAAFLGTAWYDNQPDGVIYMGKVLNVYKGTMPANTSVEVREGTVSISSYAFSFCSSLTSITLPESVTSIGEYAFSDCSRLTSITLPEGVTSIGYAAFRECSSLTSITLPEGVTSIGREAFYNCSSLTSITLPDGVTSIENYAFKGCSSLTFITLPEGVTSIGDYAFPSGLTSITCEAVTPPTINYNTFNGVNRAIPIYVPRASISVYQAASYWKNFTNIQAIIQAIIPTPENITLTIGQYGSGTYCSEYALDFSEVEGLKAYVAAGYDSETGVVTLLRVMTANAGVGLFVKGEPGDYVVPTLESTSYNALNMLVGTLEDVIVNGTDGLYTNYKYAAPDGEPLFYQFADGSTQKAGRAYLQIPTSWLTTTAAKSISYRFDDGETTDIENSEITTPNSEFIYDLYGRRVENPVKGGVYIVKGKKIVY